MAYRVNLFSAIMAALTISGLYLAGRTLTGRRWPALFGALALAVSPTFWSQALIAEIYTPGAALFIGVLLTLLLWENHGHPRYLFITGLLGGLSLGVHLTVALLAPAVGAYLLLSRRRDQPSHNPIAPQGSPDPASIRPIAPKGSPDPASNSPGIAMWRPALLGALAGTTLALLAFLIVDAHDPSANYFDAVVRPSRSAWGLQSTDLDNPLERLAFGLSALQFRPYMFTDPGQVMPQQARQYASDLPGEFAPLIIALAALGALGLLVHRRRLALLLLLALAAQWAYTFNYAIWDLYVFHIPGYVLLALLAAAGAGWLADGWHTLVVQLAHDETQRWQKRRIVEGCVALAIIVLGLRPALAPRWQAVTTGQNPPFDFDQYPVNDQALRALHPTVTATVQALDQNALLFTDWDLLYPLYYAARIDQGRTDLDFIETFPRDDTGELADSVLVYVQTQLDQRPVLFSERLPEVQQAGYAFSPVRIGPTRLYREQPIASGD